MNNYHLRLKMDEYGRILFADHSKILKEGNLQRFNNKWCKAINVKELANMTCGELIFLDNLDYIEELAKERGLV